MLEKLNVTLEFTTVLNNNPAGRLTPENIKIKKRNKKRSQDYIY